MKEKKSANLTVRLDDRMVERLEAFEKTTPLKRAEITRQALDALLRHFEKVGRVIFPLEIATNTPDLNDEAMLESAKRYLEASEPGLLKSLMKKIKEEESHKIDSFLLHMDIKDPLDRVADFDQFWKEGEQFKFIPLKGGVGSGAQVRKTPKRLIPAKYRYPDDFYALRVFGSRLDPVITDGSIIVVRPVGDRLKEVVHAVVVVDVDGRKELYIYRRETDGEPHFFSLDREEAPPPPPLQSVTIEAVLVDMHTRRPPKFPNWLEGPEEPFTTDERKAARKAARKATRDKERKSEET